MAAVLQTQPTATVKLLINGKFVESKSQVWKDIVNPATQEVISRVPFATHDEIEAAIAGAAEAFKTWKNTSIGTRARIMLKLQELIRRDTRKLAATLTAEQGKTLPDAEGDIFRGLDVVGLARRAPARPVPGPRHHGDDVDLPPTRDRIGDQMRLRSHPELHPRRGVFARQRGRIQRAAPGDQAGKLRLHLGKQMVPHRGPDAVGAD